MRASEMLVDAYIPLQGSVELGAMCFTVAAIKSDIA